MERQASPLHGRPASPAEPWGEAMKIVEIREKAESYPGVFQPFGGFADGIAVENGRMRLPQIPAVGFEAKANLWEVMRTLTE
jgi:hypothetical protein